ncbi:MAG: hypothetical protein JEZ14_04725 [Marinilabiliaceae bacterium]|nr:hypothetical protein [Marinilabiliaceae bacterium]
MGTYKKGILGNIRGKVGTVIGSRWKGIEYLRSLSGPRQGEATEAQKQHQARFAFGVRFLQPLHPVLRIGFRTQVKKKSALNAALSDLLINAIGGSYPAYQVDFNSLRIAKGTMVPPQEAQVGIENDQLQFSWSTNTTHGDAQADDTALLVACGDNMWPIFSLTEFVRGDGTGTLALPQAEAGQAIHCYLAFVGSGTRTGVSNSVPVGNVIHP